RVWRMLEQTEGRDVALAWLVGANPRLDEQTPVTGIRELRSAEVVGAALAFIDGSPRREHPGAGVSADRAVPGAARGGDGWRIAKEQYVRSAGILSVPENKRVGPLPDDAPDRRGRFDTIGRTVYFGQTQAATYAEVLQDFRRHRLALEADAEAAGFDVDEYVEAVSSQAGANNVDRPWAIGGQWQLDRCLHKVAMPSEGWWVRANDKATINQVSMDLSPGCVNLGSASSLLPTSRASRVQSRPWSRSTSAIRTSLTGPAL
ncbi:hypothetical protein NKG05_30490, partial [Oerskovia sp. M15]